jgi:hypothetical protein
MKLTLPQLSFSEKLAEFDYWITPSLKNIRASNRYKEVQRNVCQLIEIIGSNTKEFEEYSEFTPKKIGNAIVLHITELDVAPKVHIIEALATFLFLVTGKSDNNVKCQFPLFLRDIVRVNVFPKVLSSQKKKLLSWSEIPREIKSDRLAKLVADLNGFPEVQLEILTQYISFILDDESYLKSFWTIGKTFFEMKKVGFEKDFLLPLIVFQVRGSVSASGGHEPEDYLRDRMKEWGLLADKDFNSCDIIIHEVSQPNQEVQISIGENESPEDVLEKIEESVKKKTRAYDFVLPYNVVGWEQRLFVQCQFYAGDSGSVSHKNVDQTRTSRDYVKTRRNNPIFLEYIDGAGYFSSLLGDLKKIISMPDTEDFFQVRTSVIKLRGKLQQIGFLTPLEVIHAWALNNGDVFAIFKYLVNEGYTEAEIERVLTNPCFMREGGIIEVDERMIETSRRYLLLDFIALKGSKFSEVAKVSGVILVPAFGHFHGIRLEEITQKIISSAGKFREDWLQSGLIFQDIQFLADQGWIIQR